MRPVEILAGSRGGTWELYRDACGVPVVKIEIQQAGCSPGERAMILAEVKKLMRAAVDGELKPYLDVKSIRRRPTVFELRWEIGDDFVPARLWRLYFVWWPNLGPLRFALHFAEKPRGDAGAAIQNHAIDTAWDRYKQWSDRTSNR